MQEIVIGSNEAGQRINKFLMKYLNKAPSGFVYKMIRKKNIKLNDNKINGNEIIYVGDVVKLFLSDETISNFRDDSKAKPQKSRSTFKLEVIYRDKNILIADKPVGVLSQKAEKKDYSLNDALIDYLLSNNLLEENQLNTYKPSICNRLDRNTSGLILCGISLKGSQELSRMLKERLIDKYYITLVRGRVDHKICADAYLAKNEEGNTVVVYSSKPENIKTEHIITEYEPIKSTSKYTMLEVKLITGKTHQIRAHLAYLGYPVVGDRKYGDVSVNMLFARKYRLKNQLLHSGKVVFNETSGSLSYLNGKSYTAFLPEKFKEIEKDIFKC